MKMGSIKGRMLFVDDRSKRIHAALEKYGPDYDVTIATNVRDALRLMSSEEFDVVSLDHDLNGCDFEDPDSPTCGMEIVRYIQKTGWPRPKAPSFWIHSTNLFASFLMWNALHRMELPAFQRPFKYGKGENIVYDERGIPR
jgi:CheY-like chemotaxis protein